MATNLVKTVSRIQDYQYSDAAEAAALLRYGVVEFHEELEDRVANPSYNYWQSGSSIKSLSLPSLSFLGALGRSTDALKPNIRPASLETDVSGAAPGVATAARYPGEKPTEVFRQKYLATYGLKGPGTFSWLKLKNIVECTPDCKRFDFEFEDPKLVSKFPVSSTCVVRSHIDNLLYAKEGTKALCPPEDEHDGKALIVRAYTPVNSGSVGYLSFLIKKQGPGGMSEYIHNLKLGEKLGIMGFLQRPPSMVNWEKNSYDAVTMITGGVGITPLIQILEYSLSDEENITKFVLIYKNKTERDIIMRREIDGYRKKYNTKLFEVVHVLPKIPDNWEAGEGVSLETDDLDFTEVLKKYAAPPDVALGLKVLVCVSGPPGMIKDIAGPREADDQGTLSGVLKTIGYTKEQVHKF